MHGQYYFEADVRGLDDGLAAVGVWADPAAAYSMYHSPFFDEVSAAGTTLETPGLISVAVDFDAGVVGLYVDGALLESRSLAMLPGIGAYRAAVDSRSTVTALNLGSAPFVYDVPDGYVAWQTNEGGTSGPCVSTRALPPARPTIEVIGESNTDWADCGSETGCGSFLSDADADTQLVFLGAYNTGSQPNWMWGTDENGNPIEVPVEGGHSGSVRVELNRPGRVALALSGFEPTAWTLDVGPNTDLVSVNVYGFYAATIAGVPDGVPVDVQTNCIDTNGGGNCEGFSANIPDTQVSGWPFVVSSGDTQRFVSFVEEQVCLPLKVFAGANYARGFRIY